MKKFKVIVGVIIVFLILSGGFLFYKSKSEKPKADGVITEVVVEAAKETEPIIEEAMNWNSSLEVIEKILPEDNSKARVEEDEITHVVLHFISNVAENVIDPYNIDDVFSVLEEYEVSSHYVIDRDGQIYLFTPEERVAYHAGRGTLEGYTDYTNKLNEHSIGIEMLAIGTEEEMSSMINSEHYNRIDSSLIGYTDKQYEAVGKLLKDIDERHDGIKIDADHVVGHDDYSPDKTDPGSLFDWNRIGL